MVSQHMSERSMPAMWVALLLLVAVADAFHCTGLSLRNSFRNCAIRMTQDPPPAKLALPKAKLEAAQVNSKQWGTSADGDDTAQGTQPPGAAEQEAAIKKAKELAKTAAAKKPQVGAGTVRLGTQTGLGRKMGTQPVPVKGKRLGTVRVGVTQPAGKELASKAETPAVMESSDAQSLDPLLALIEKAGKKSWMSEAGGRAITNAEALAVVAMTMPLTESELISYLRRKGYEGEVLEAMLAKVLVGRQGQLELTMAEQDLEKAANMFAQADIYEEEAKALEKEAQDLIDKARLLGPDILALTEKIEELEGEMASWEWVPEWVPLGPRGELVDAQEKLDALTQKRQGLDEQIGVLEDEKADKERNCNWDREDAGILRNNALRAINTAEGDDSGLCAAEALLDNAEAALKTGGKAAALEVLLEGTAQLEKIDLRPDRRASSTSLPGRLHLLLTAPAARGDKPSSDDGNWITRLLGA